jgi:organic radical activating enzyme
MTAEEIVAKVSQWKDCGFVVLTGGEPALQVDEPLIEALHREGFYIAIETNGTCPLPSAIDWVTVSPKNSFVAHAPSIVVNKVDEVKVVFDGIHDPAAYIHLGNSPYLCLQPCDTGDAERNRDIVGQCVAYIKQHPQWRLSLQTHKFIDIP